MRRTHVLLLALVVVVATACVPLATPADTSRIESMGTTTVDGWRYDAYRDRGYPCSISGYQTFVIGTKVGASATEPHPLFVYMHGGGVGYFDADGNPVPGPGQKVEESGTSLTNRLTNNGLLGRIRQDPAGFRTLAVSYCSHDLYAGSVTPDPHNPNLTPEGGSRPTTGLPSTIVIDRKGRVAHVQLGAITDPQQLIGPVSTIAAEQG